MERTGHGTVNASAYRGAERRAEGDRRIRADQRHNVRFDESGGDRRSGLARRASDEGLRESDFD